MQKSGESVRVNVQLIKAVNVAGHSGSRERKSRKLSGVRTNTSGNSISYWLLVIGYRLLVIGYCARGCGSAMISSTT